MAKPVKEFRSNGHIACDNHTATSHVLKVAEAAGIVPAMKLNGVPYYTGADAERIAALIESQRAPLAAARKAAVK